jgi:hypothetical protein
VLSRYPIDTMKTEPFDGMQASRRTGIAVALAILGCLAVWWLGMRSPLRLVTVVVVSYLLPWSLAWTLAPSRRRCIVANFALSLMGIAIVWLPLEGLGALGVINYQSLFRAPISEWWYGAPYNVVDPELLYVHRPYLRLSGSQPGDIAAALCLEGPRYAYDVEYDRNGFRNEADLTAANIVVIGDSFIEAPTMPSAQLMSTVLAHLTGRTVANLGLSAYGPQQELAVLKRYALALRPRVIVWAFYEGNDFKDLRRYEGLRDQVLGVRAPALLRTSLARNSIMALYRGLRGCGDRQQSLVSSGMFRAIDDSGVRMYFLHRTQTVTDADLTALARILGEADEITRQNDIRLLLLFVPTSFRVYHDLVACTPESECATDDLPQRVESTISNVSRRIEYVDLTPVFRAAAARGELIYRPDDIHWAPAGHRLAAEITMEVLASMRANDER